MAIGTKLPMSIDFSSAIDEYTVDNKNIWDTAYQNTMAPYEQAFDETANEYGKTLNALKQDYENALETSKQNYETTIDKAYESYLSNKRAVEFSNLGTGDVRNMLENAKLAYEESRRNVVNNYEENKRNIYDTYIKNQNSLQNNYNNFLKSYFEQVTSTQNLIDKEKSTMATNYENFVYSLRSYMNELYQSHPDMFKSNPLLNKFYYFKDDENGYGDGIVEDAAFLELLTEERNGERVFKDEEGLEDLINLLTSIGGENEKDIVSYESFLRDNKNYTDLYSWLKENNNANLYTMYDVLGFNRENLFRTDTTNSDMLVKYGEGDNEVTMYKYADETGTYTPLDTSTYEVRKDNVIVNGIDYDLQDSKTELPVQITNILNYMSTGNAKAPEDSISKGTLQIYDNNLYKYNGSRWIKIIDGDYKVAEVIDELQAPRDVAKDIGTVGEATWSTGGSKKLNGVTYVPYSEYTRFNTRHDKYIYTTSNNDSTISKLPTKYRQFLMEHPDQTIEYNGNMYTYGKDKTTNKYVFYKMFENPDYRG